MGAVQAPGDGLEACGIARDQVGLVLVVVVVGCGARVQVELVLVVVVAGCGGARDQVELVLV